MKNTFYLLMAAKSLRNACAHNNCILNFLGADGGEVRLGDDVAQALGRKSKMKNCRLQQIVTTLYLHKRFASEGVISHRAESLQAFKNRMLMHVDYYKGSAPRVMSTFYFLAAVIDFFALFLCDQPFYPELCSDRFSQRDFHLCPITHGCTSLISAGS